MDAQPVTIRSLIAAKSHELKGADNPALVAEILKDLSSLLASINKECADRKYWLALKRLELLKEHSVVAKANIHAEASPEYKDWNECEEYRKATLEMIRSCKYFLRTAEAERKESVY